jgi:hypothetical protein
MIFRAFAISVLALAACSMSYAAELQSNWIACDSEETFDAYSMALSQNDRASMDALKQASSCVNTDVLRGRGAKVVVLKRGLVMLKVQVSVGTTSGVLYVDTGAVK